MNNGIIAIILMAVFTINNGDFVTEQKKYDRVRTAYAGKETLLKESLKKMDLSLDRINILIIAFKAEMKLEVYVKGVQDKAYKKFKAYDICDRSGDLGPKRKQGDGQVPEGFYTINHFNPQSNFYLSLGIDYPNRSDRILSSSRDLGGDIYIHGECVTIGCIPMTNDRIKEIYLLAVEARNNGQEKIPVYIFPFRMSDGALETFSKRCNDEKLHAFWINLKSGYDLFFKTYEPLTVKIDNTGKYIFD